MSELRWNPLLGEWVATATVRQDRTYHPPPEYCPLCPTRRGGFASEVPEETYDIVVFENRYPTLTPDPPPPTVEPTKLYPVRPSQGVCEIVLYSPDHTTTLGREPVEQIDKLVRVWTDRFLALGRIDCVKYVFIFENKGDAIGVGIDHPHGQIYGSPFVPPRIARELDESREHQDRTGRCLLCDMLAEERGDGRRVVAENESFTAYVPFSARWPYEVHIVARRHLQALSDLTRSEQRELAGMLKMVTATYDNLFDISFPYMMALHQRPTDGHWYDSYHFHVEFYPPLQSATRQKYMAGSEIGAGFFVNDTLPEEKADELRKLVEPVVWARARGLK